MRRSKRRSTAQPNDGASQESSSDEVQLEQTMDIINKMSKKLLDAKESRSRPKQKKRDGKNLSSNKSSTPVTRITRSRSKPRRCDTDYEGDLDTTESTSQSDSSTKSADLYDFDQADEENLRLVLFPDDKKSKTVGKKKGKKNAKENKSSQKVIPTNKPSGKSLKQSNSNLQPAKPQSKGVKRKPTETTQIIQKSRKVATPEISLMDSGVFMSPIERVRDSTLRTPDVTPIPTPSLSITDYSVDEKAQGSVPRLEYDSLLEPPLGMSPVKDSRNMSASFSPVRSPKTEPMDVGSPDLKSPIAEKTYSHRGQYMSPIERREKQKQMKARSKPRITTKRVDDWASKMNAEFAEIEMYDLSIEDQ